jgi:hypothetical protein
LLPTIIRMLEPLASSRALHLVVGLYISGALLLACPDERLLIPFFLVQRGIVITLLWSSLNLYAVATSAAASVAVGLIYLVTAWCLYVKVGDAIARLRRGALPLTHLPFRALAAALAVLLTYGLVQRYAPAQLPPLLSWSVAWLLVEFCFALLLAPSPLYTGLGILAFADAGRILYALTRPDPLIWGLWAACDVLVALAAAHLRTVEVACEGGDSQRRARRGIGEILAGRRAPTPSTETARPEATISTQEADKEPVDPAALSAASAVEAEPSDQPEPEIGDTSCTSTG